MADGNGARTAAATAPRASRSVEIGFLLTAAALIAIQLFVPPIVGVADNGDFSRVASPLGIFPPPEIGGDAYFGWIVPEYRFDAKKIWVHGLCCYSSETLFGAAAMPVGRVISPPGRFRLEAMGIVNAMGLLAAILLLLVALRPLPAGARVAGGALVVLVFTDGASVSYLNSFYTEPAALIFFLASVALALSIAQR
ncbi:MAG TPA: hypothetical protein VIY96_04705, partial [Thermoanaerobaculia bacterium]